jgi:hypothetical protein
MAALAVQVTPLPNLVKLEVCRFREGQDLSSLGSLAPTLRHLSMDACSLPDCLGDLTALQSLAVIDSWADNAIRSTLAASDVAKVDEALPRLRQLTHLQLASLPSLPASLSRLAALAAAQRLHTLYLVFTNYTSIAQTALLECVRWAAHCTSLRRLEVDSNHLREVWGAALATQRSHPGGLVVDIGHRQPAREDEHDFHMLQEHENP